MSEVVPNPYDRNAAFGGGDFRYSHNPAHTGTSNKPTGHIPGFANLFPPSQSDEAPPPTDTRVGIFANSTPEETSSSWADNRAAVSPMGKFWAGLGKELEEWSHKKNRSLPIADLTLAPLVYIAGMVGYVFALQGRILMLALHILGIIGSSLVYLVREDSEDEKAAHRDALKARGLQIGRDLLEIVYGVLGVLIPPAAYRLEANLPLAPEVMQSMQALNNRLEALNAEAERALQEEADLANQQREENSQAGQNSLSPPVQFTNNSSVFRPRLNQLLVHTMHRQRDALGTQYDYAPHQEQKRAVLARYKDYFEESVNPLKKIFNLEFFADATPERLDLLFKLALLPSLFDFDPDVKVDPNHPHIRTVFCDERAQDATIRCHGGANEKKAVYQKAYRDLEEKFKCFDKKWGTFQNVSVSLFPNFLVQNLVLEQPRRQILLYFLVATCKPDDVADEKYYKTTDQKDMAERARAMVETMEWGRTLLAVVRMLNSISNTIQMDSRMLYAVLSQDLFQLVNKP